MTMSSWLFYLNELVNNYFKFLTLKEFKNFILIIISNIVKININWKLFEVLII